MAIMPDRYGNLSMEAARQQALARQRQQQQQQRQQQQQQQRPPEQRSEPAPPPQTQGQNILKQLVEAAFAPGGNLYTPAAQPPRSPVPPPRPASRTRPRSRDERSSLPINRGSPLPTPGADPGEFVATPDGDLLTPTAEALEPTRARRTSPLQDLVTGRVQVDTGAVQPGGARTIDAVSPTITASGDLLTPTAQRFGSPSATAPAGSVRSAFQEMFASVATAGGDLLTPTAHQFGSPSAVTGSQAAAEPDATERFRQALGPSPMEELARFAEQAQQPAPAGGGFLAGLGRFFGRLFGQGTQAAELPQESAGTGVGVTDGQGDVTNLVRTDLERMGIIAPGSGMLEEPGAVLGGTPGGPETAVLGGGPSGGGFTPAPAGAGSAPAPAPAPTPAPAGTVPAPAAEMAGGGLASNELLEQALGLIQGSGGLSDEEFERLRREAALIGEMEFGPQEEALRRQRLELQRRIEALQPGGYLYEQIVQPYRELEERLKNLNEEQKRAAMIRLNDRGAFYAGVLEDRLAQLDRELVQALGNNARDRANKLAQLALELAIQEELLAQQGLEIAHQRAIREAAAYQQLVRSAQEEANRRRQEQIANLMAVAGVLSQQEHQAFLRAVEMERLQRERAQASGRSALGLGGGSGGGFAGSTQSERAASAESAIFQLVRQEFQAGALPVPTRTQDLVALADDLAAQAQAQGIAISPLNALQAVVRGFGGEFVTSVNHVDGATYAWLVRIRDPRTGQIVTHLGPRTGVWQTPLEQRLGQF